MKYIAKNPIVTFLEVETGSPILIIEDNPVDMTIDKSGNRTLNINIADELHEEMKNTLLQ